MSVAELKAQLHQMIDAMDDEQTLAASLSFIAQGTSSPQCHSEFYGKPSGELGAHRGKMWISDDFDAPLPYMS